MAVVAVRTRTLRVLAYDEQLEVLRMLVDRREELTRQRIQTVNRLQRLLAELTPGKVKKDITALQAKAILSGVRPRDMVGKTRKMLALEQLAEMVALDAKVKASTKEMSPGARTRLQPDGPDRGRPGGRRPDPGRRR